MPTYTMEVYAEICREWDREREREIEGERDRERETEKEKEKEGWAERKIDI